MSPNFVPCPQIDVRVSALSMVYDLLMRFGLQAFVNKDDSGDGGVEDHADITALLDVELSARKRQLVRHKNWFDTQTVAYSIHHIGCCCV